MNKQIIIIITLVTIAIFLVMGMNCGQYDRSIPFVVLLVAAVFVCMYLLYQQKSIYKGMWHKPSNIFLFGYLIVSFQYLLDFCLGYKTYHDFYISSSVNKMAITCLLGLLSFIMGYVLTKDRLVSNKITCNNKVISIGFLVILQMFFFIAWIMTVNIAALISGQGYFEDLSGTTSSNYEMFFYDVTIVILISIIINSNGVQINSIKEFAKKGSILSWMIICLYCLLRLVSGDRGPALYMALAVFFAYLIASRKSIRLSKILLFAILGAFILNLVGIARSLSLDKSFSERVTTAFTEFSGSSEARFSEKTILPITEESAMSHRSNQIAIDLVYNGEDHYHYRKYCFYQLIQCIPFVPSFLAHTLNIPEDELSANIKMTDIYYGRHDFAQIGTTVVADSYFDGGIIGVILMLFFCGWAFRKVDFGVCISPPSNWFQIAVVILFASMAVYIPRSTLIIQLKQLVPIGFFYYINYIIFCKR